MDTTPLLAQTEWVCVAPAAASLTRSPLGSHYCSHWERLCVYAQKIYPVGSNRFFFTINFVRNRVLSFPTSDRPTSRLAAWPFAVTLPLAAPTGVLHDAALFIYCWLLGCNRNSYNIEFSLRSFLFYFKRCSGRKKGRKNHGSALLWPVVPRASIRTAIDDPPPLPSIHFTPPVWPQAYPHSFLSLARQPLLKLVLTSLGRMEEALNIL